MHDCVECLACRSPVAACSCALCGVCCVVSKIVHTWLMRSLALISYAGCVYVGCYDKHAHLEVSSC
jgi:hypothetical protein